MRHSLCPKEDLKRSENQNQFGIVESSTIIEYRNMFWLNNFEGDSDTFFNIFFKNVLFIFSYEKGSKIDENEAG